MLLYTAVCISRGRIFFLQPVAQVPQKVTVTRSSGAGG